MRREIATREGLWVPRPRPQIITSLSSSPPSHIIIAIAITAIITTNQEADAHTKPAQARIRNTIPPHQTLTRSNLRFAEELQGHIRHPGRSYPLADDAAE
eukprot:958959-Rhodomonas_salina.6